MTLGEIRFPIDRVHLEITNACNFDCTFCPEGIMTRKLGVMDPLEFDFIAEQLAEGPLVNKVMLHLMGEPMIHPKFFELVRIGASHGLHLHLTTNGSKLPEETIDELLTCGLGEITLSLQTPDRKSFDTSRGTSMDWDKYAEGVTRLAARAVQLPNATPVTVDMLITARQNLMLPTREDVSWLMSTPQLQAILEVWTKRIHAAAAASGSAFDLDAALQQCRAASINRWNRFAIHPRLSYETRQLGDWANAFADETGREVRPAKYGSCNTLREQFGILWNGDVVLCCADYDGDTVVGNCFETSLKEVLQSEECRQIRADFDRLRLKHKHCQKCLGGTTRAQSAMHQVGSVAYHHIYKRWFKDPSYLGATLSGPTGD